MSNWLKTEYWGECVGSSSKNQVGNSARKLKEITTHNDKLNQFYDKLLEKISSALCTAIYLKSS